MCKACLGVTCLEIRPRKEAEGNCYYQTLLLNKTTQSIRYKYKWNTVLKRHLRLLNETVLNTSDKICQPGLSTISWSRYCVESEDFSWSNPASCPNMSQKSPDELFRNNLTLGDLINWRPLMFPWHLFVFNIVPNLCCFPRISPSSSAASNLLSLNEKWWQGLIMEVFNYIRYFLWNFKPLVLQSLLITHPGLLFANCYFT